MTTLASDSFDTDGVDLGANWHDAEPGWEVASQQATANTVDSDATAEYAAVVFPSDQWAQCSMGTVVVPTTGEGAGPMVRCLFGPQTDLVSLRGNTVETRVYKRITGGVQTQLGSDGPSVTTGDVLYIEVQGTTIIAKKNGAPICGSPIDGSGGTGIPASGKPGIRSFGLGGATVDNWSAGDLTAVPPKMGRRIYILP